MSSYNQRVAGHSQPEISMSPATDCPVADQVQPVLDDRSALKDPDGPQVAVLSAALLRSVINAYGEGNDGFAVRAGVSAEVAAEAVSGTRPAWDLPYTEFAALAGAVAALWHCAALETAAACDLLLTCVLNGEQFMATDVLTGPDSRVLARAMLRLAITGETDKHRRQARGALLSDDLLALLSERAAMLADSESPDAWIGSEILRGHASQRTADQLCRRMSTSVPAGRMDANGTAWRMRSLVAMGHDASRIAQALDVTPDRVRRLICGNSQTVTVALHLLACQLWDAWWDKTPPERTKADRRAAVHARHQAKRHDWPAAAGLDEGQLDTLGYRPSCHYRPATGTGVAADFSSRTIRQRTTKKSA